MGGWLHGWMSRADEDLFIVFHYYPGALWQRAVIVSVEYARVKPVSQGIIL